MAGVWGKLRGHGDFIGLGLDEAARACVVPWLDAGLAALRDGWGEGWGSRFDGMGALGFWIGPAVAGGAPVAGVMAPSRDRVGRRYPLLILGRGEAPPPMLAASGFHAAAGAALAALLEAGRVEAGDWPRDLGEAAPAAVPDDPSLVWARNPGCRGDDLLAEIAHYDHAAACAGRAQFWTLGAPGAVLTCDGLPSARALGWLIEASQDRHPEAGAAPVDGHSEVLAEPPPADIAPPAHGGREGGAAGVAAAGGGAMSQGPASASATPHPQHAPASAAPEFAGAASAGAESAAPEFTASEPASPEPASPESAAPEPASAAPPLPVANAALASGGPAVRAPDPDATAPDALIHDAPVSGARAAPPSAAPEGPADAALRLEPRFRLGAEEQADSRLVLRSEWVLPEGAARPGRPVDAGIWQLSEPPADPAPGKAKEAE